LLGALHKTRRGRRIAAEPDIDAAHRVILDAELAADLRRHNRAACNEVAVKPQTPIASPRISWFPAVLGGATPALIVANCDIKTQPRRPPANSPGLSAGARRDLQAANVLKHTPRAIAMGVYVVRALVRLRKLLASNTAARPQAR